MMRALILIFALALLNSCRNESTVDSGKQKATKELPSFKDLQASSKVMVIDTSYSPDGSAMLLKYNKVVPLGSALPGYLYEYTAIVHPEDLDSSISGYSFRRSDYDAVRWGGYYEVDLFENYHGFKRRGQSKFEKDHFSMNGIRVNVRRIDPLDSTFKRTIHVRKYSPDSSKLIVAYQYFHPIQKYEYVHMSLINPGDSIPKYGNFYISEQQTWGCVSDFRWKGNDTIILSVESVCMGKPEGYLVKDRPELAIQEKLWVQPRVR